MRLAASLSGIAKVKATRSLKGRLNSCYDLISPEWKVPAQPLEEGRAVCVSLEGSWADTESRRQRKRKSVPPL